jgi:lipopolysaccharide/colanic/teichoic acid biosynthesis glycosyltransferase
VVVDRIVITSAFNRLAEEARSALLDVERNSTIRLDFFAERFQLDAGAGETGGRSGAASTTGHGIGESGALARSLTAPLLAPGDIRPQGVYWRLKRIFDVALAGILLAVLSPVIMAVAVIVAVDVGLPVTFWQQRPGRFGQPFRLWKFRSMKAAHDCRGHRISDEQRQSRIGRFMRRTRLDELPQLYNILIGEMSFVGPRPLLQRDQQSDAFARLLARPGLTGWAQINGGNTVTVEDKMALDLWYMRHADIWLDLRIMLETVRIVLHGERANPIAVRMAWKEISAADIRTVGVDASTDLIDLQSRRVA